MVKRRPSFAPQPKRSASSFSFSNGWTRCSDRDSRGVLCIWCAPTAMSHLRTHPVAQRRYKSMRIGADWRGRRATMTKEWYGFDGSNRSNGSLLVFSSSTRNEPGRFCYGLGMPHDA